MKGIQKYTRVHVWLAATPKNSTERVITEKNEWNSGQVIPEVGWGCVFYCGVAFPCRVSTAQLESIPQLSSTGRKRDLDAFLYCSFACNK